MGLGQAILSIAVLGFLGLGLQPPAAEWGAMISASLPHMYEAPHLVLMPTLFIAMTVGGLLLVAGGWRTAP
jgi:ABC-type dipeptide/oligopeptide/nickel transport system permease subunit